MCVVSKFPDSFCSRVNESIITKLTMNGFCDIPSLPHDAEGWKTQLSFLEQPEINSTRRTTGNTANRILIFKFDIHFDCAKRI
jgi:hypothetical protein